MISFDRAVARRLGFLLEGPHRIAVDVRRRVARHARSTGRRRRPVRQAARGAEGTRDRVRPRPAGDRHRRHASAPTAATLTLELRTVDDASFARAAARAAAPRFRPPFTMERRAGAQPLQR